MSELVQEGPFQLPGGFVIDGRVYRDAYLRPLTGREEELIAEYKQLRTSQLISLILSRCLTRIGPIQNVTIDNVRDLLVGDRDYLILKLRHITFGKIIRGTLRCPSASCAKMMDIDFDLETIPINKKEITTEGTFILELSPFAAYTDSNGVKHTQVVFRLPNGGDQEAISNIIEVNEAKALTTLLARCIKRIGEITSIDENITSSLSILGRREIEDAMRENSPSIALEMQLNCPECNTTFTSPFDIQNFLLEK